MKPFIDIIKYWNRFAVCRNGLIVDTFKTRQEAHDYAAQLETDLARDYWT